MLSACFKMLTFLLLSVSLIGFAEHAKAESVKVNVNEEVETPFDTLYQLLLGELATVTSDKEVLLNDEAAIVLSKGTWKDADVAAYKIKYKRLPIVLPLTKYMPQDNDSATEHIQQESSVVYEDDHQQHRAQAVQRLEADNNALQGQYVQSTGGSVRAEPEYSDDQLAQMILSSGKASDIYYLYVNLPHEAEARQQLIESLEVIFEDDMQSNFTSEDFVRLPKSFQQLWKVRLGVTPPRFQGGYQ